jgi:hypothetical protein
VLQADIRCSSQSTTSEVQRPQPAKRYCRDHPSGENDISSLEETSTLLPADWSPWQGRLERFPMRTLFAKWSRLVSVSPPLSTTILNSLKGFSTASRAFWRTAGYFQPE